MCSVCTVFVPFKFGAFHSVVIVKDFPEFLKLHMNSHEDTKNNEKRDILHKKAQSDCDILHKKAQSDCDILHKKHNQTQRFIPQK